MPSLTTQRDLREVQKLSFCYLCGQTFAPEEKPTRDHLPPSSLFLKEDRDPPLILPAHEICNGKQHVQDELLGELVGLVCGREIKPRQRPLRVEVREYNRRPISLLKGISFSAFLSRCVRGFHAALYGEWLPEATHNAFHPPFEGAQLDPDTGKPLDTVQGMLARDQGLRQQSLFIAELKKNRMIGNTDRVVTRNGKCSYECVWSRLDNGKRICIFALKVYDWERAGDVLGFRNRGCVGVYRPQAGAPAGASLATNLEFPFPRAFHDLV